MNPIRQNPNYRIPIVWRHSPTLLYPSYLQALNYNFLYFS
jgi:hypothetical protein